MALTAAVFILLAAACVNPANSPEPPAGKGQVRISLSLTEETRTVMPDLADFVRCTLKFVPGDGGEGLELPLEAADGTAPRTTTVELRPGDWTINAEGWVNATAGTPARLVKTATGSAAVRVLSGNTATVALALDRIDGEPGSTGTLAWELRFPATFTAGARLSLSRQDESGEFVPYEQLELTVTNGLGVGTKSLPVGYYRADATLTGAGFTKSWNVVAYIHSWLETRLPAMIITAEDIPEPETPRPAPDGNAIVAASPAALAADLAALPVNNAETPYRARVSGVNLSSKAGEGGRLLDLYEAICRYVELDLSDCTGSSFTATVKSEGKKFIVGIRLPETVKTISGTPFGSFDVLVRVELPGITNIGKGVFETRKILRIVTLGPTPPTLKENALPPNLEEIRVPAGAAAAYQSNGDPAWTTELKALVREY